MITKGIGDIRSIRTINTRPGPMTEKSLLLRLYKLASQKASFQKKKEWAERQRTQAVRHLIDVQKQIKMLKKLAMKKTGSAPLSVAAASNPGKAETPKQKKKWNKVSLKY